jgi:dTDP-4-amino-4,6-dideoxygalactose transaminase
MISLAAREREAETHFLERNAAELASGPHPIKLFQPSFRVAECLDEIKECLEKGWTGIGFKTRQIETAWTDYTGHEHAHFVTSATVGLHLAWGY